MVLRGEDPQSPPACCPRQCMLFVCCLAEWSGAERFGAACLGLLLPGRLSGYQPAKMVNTKRALPLRIMGFVFYSDRDNGVPIRQLIARPSKTRKRPLCAAVIGPVSSSRFSLPTDAENGERELSAARLGRTTAACAL